MIGRHLRLPHRRRTGGGCQRRILQIGIDGSDIARLDECDVLAAIGALGRIVGGLHQ